MPYRPRPPLEANGSAKGGQVGHQLFMSCFLYILKNTNGRHYIGITDDVEVRLNKHNRGHVRSTKAYGPWLVVHTEEFRDKTEARKREVFLKKTALARKVLFEKLASSSNG